MKKTLSIALVFVCLLALVSCDPGINSVSKEDLLENTVKIELYDYANESPMIIRLNSKQPSFDFNKATLIATLDESHFDGIISDMAEQEYLDFGTALNEPMGKTLVLHQKNGNMIVLFGCIYKKQNRTYYYGDCSEFDKNGVFVKYVGDVSHVFIDEIETNYFSTK